MPWSVFEDGNRYCVHKLTPDGGKGERVACHGSEAEARAQVRALYANEPTASKIAKVDEDEQLVFGWAYISTDKAGELVVDGDGESIEPGELETAVYDYVLDFGVSGEMHKGEANGRLVESLMLTPEKAEAMGLSDQATGWWVGFKVDDADAFSKVKSGEYAMFSIQGIAEAGE